MCRGATSDGYRVQCGRCYWYPGCEVSRERVRSWETVCRRDPPGWRLGVNPSGNTYQGGGWVQGEWPPPRLISLSGLPPDLHPVVWEHLAEEAEDLAAALVHELGAANVFPVFREAHGRVVLVREQDLPTTILTLIGRGHV